MHVSRNILLSFIFILRFAKSKQAESDTYLCFNEIYELENVIAASDENVRKVLTKLKEQFELEQNEKGAESAESKIQQNEFQDAKEYKDIAYEWYKRSSQEIVYRTENIRHLHKGVDIARASFLEFYKQFTHNSNGNPSEFYALMKSDWVSIVVLERGSSFTKFVREERNKIFDAFELIRNRLETQNLAHFLTSFTNKCALIFKSIDSYILTKDSADLTKKQNKKQVFKMEKSEKYAFIDTFVNLNSLLSGAIMKLREIDEFLISQEEISRFEIAAFNLVLICEYISSINLYKQEVQASENLKRRIYRELHVLEFVREEIEETIETVKFSSKTPPKNAEDNNLQVEKTLEHVITSSLDGIIELKKYTAENLKDTDFEDSYNEFIKQYSANITTVMYKPKTWDAKTQVTFTLFETYYKLALEAHARKAEQSYLNTERSEMIVQLRIAIFELKNALLVTEEFVIDKFNAEVCQTINLLTPRLEETFLAVYALTEAMSKEESEYKKFSASALETLDKEVRNLIMAEKNLKSHQLSENSKVISKKFTDYFNTLEFDNNIKSIRTRIDDISKIRDVRYATRERFKIDSQSFNIEMLDGTQKNDYNFLEDKRIEVGRSLESLTSNTYNPDFFKPNKDKYSAKKEGMITLLKNIKKVYSEQITKVEIDACYSECEKIVKEKTALFTSHQLVRIATINVEMLGLLTEKMVCENYEIQLIGDIKASKAMPPETTQNKPWFLTRAITTAVNYTRLNKFWQKQLSGDDIKITDTFKQDMKALYETDTNGNAVGERNDAKEIVDNLVLVANVFLHYIPIPKKIENNGSQENQPTETHISWLHRLMSHCTNQKATFLAAQEGNQSNALRAEAERKSTEEVRLKRAEATIKKLSDEQKFREFAELKKRAETAQKTTNEAFEKAKKAKEHLDQKVSKMEGLQKSKEDTEKILNDLQEQYNNKFQEFDAIKSKHNAWLREARSHESETADKEFLIEYHAKCETAPKILEDLQTKISGVQEKSNKEHLALQKATDDVKTANKNLEYQVSLANACKTYSDKLANKEKVARASLPSANE